MKFIVENYSSYEDTQAMYFNKFLKEAGHESFIWDSKNSSLYDIMDSLKPDFFITHAYKISKDLVHYVNNVSTKVSVFLSVNNVSDDNIVAIEKALLENKVPCGFMYGSQENVMNKKIRYVNINNCYDVNILPKEKVIDYSINTGVFINDKSQLALRKERSYHFLSNDQEMKSMVDICLPEISMASLYRNYDKIIFKNIEKHIPQAMFDAIIECDKVYYESDDEKVHSMIQRVFKPEKSLDHNSEDKLTDFSELKNRIKEKHGASNRVKTLLSQLPKE